MKKLTAITLALLLLAGFQQIIFIVCERREQLPRSDNCLQSK